MRGEPTPVGVSGNITIWEESFDVVLVVVNCLVLLITSVVGIAANAFVILAVCHQKSLQTSVNALVVNLAVVDALRCVIDCPVLLNIITTVHRRGRVGGLFCDTQMASFSFSCCVQLSTLACISAERYQAIAKPFEARQRKRRVRTLIPLTWTLAVLVAVFCQIFLRDSPVYVRCQGWQRGTFPSFDTSGLYVLLPLWASCFGLITGFYMRIFALVRSHNRKIFDKGISAANKGSAENKQNPETTVVKTEPEQIQSVAQTQPGSNQFMKKSPLTSGEAPQSESVSSEGETEFKNPAEMSHLEKDRPHPLAGQVEEKPLKAESCSPISMKTEREASNQDPAANVPSSNDAMQNGSTNLNTENLFEDTLKTDTAYKETRPQVVMPEQREDPEAASVLMTDLKQVNNSTRAEEAQGAPVVDQMPSPQPDPNNEAMRLEGAVCIMPSKASKERVRKRKESKLAKRAGYIIITFLLFWLPLLTSILVNLVVHKNRTPRKLIVQDLEILSVSVTCITSLSDPIIYAAVNPQFRSEFYKLKSSIKSRFTRS
ncbi:uncharacterized protein parietopsin [Austrofundulus limnaeus]|uniref:Uncharacterized protein parietopsin n=1 Tax=Austrofundulus limnaeus TaxID=52670 RepID=A0A2I4BY30_AUSLI|nr:PREDICTED: uncharacterized protein LOC106523654 [Austrofundulus limnaeus]